MQVVILAGGLWTRLSEETTVKPKPMVEIGWRPILWHIMKIYSQYGYKDFVICLWYKWYMIKEWFANYLLHNSDVTIDTQTGGQITVHNTNTEDWKVTLIDTGDNSGTWWRIKRIGPYINGNTFMMTYGDGLSDIDLDALLQFHESHGKLATLTAIQPEWKFGRLGLEWDMITEFAEKKDNIDSWINGGFMVLNKKVLDYIESDEVMFERDPLERIAHDHELMSYKHRWFWHAMDTLKNRTDLETMLATGKAPWKIW